MTGSLPDNPLDTFAGVYSDGGMPIAQARDTVILRCLAAGDVSAFSYFVLAGHQPGREVLRTMAFMASECVPDVIVDVVPFKLKTARRKSIGAGKRINPLVVMRDELIELNIQALVSGGLKRGAAEAAVAEMISGKQDMAKGRSRKHETVRKARKRRSSASDK